MHELSIALSILDVAAEEARRQGNPQVCAIHVRLGPLSGVIPEALRSAYELAREATPLSTAELVIDTVPLRGFCQRCNAVAELLSVQQLCCRQCGTPTAEVVSGTELELVALEVENEDANTPG